MSREFIINGGFTVNDFGTLNGNTKVLTTPVGMSEMFSRCWYLGPGGNVSANAYVAPRDGNVAMDNAGVDPEEIYYAQLQWANYPTVGEAQYLPNFRFTFLENHWLGDVREVVGWFDVTMWAASAWGNYRIRPILWHNYADNDYRIFENDNWTLTQGQWKRYTMSIYCPKYTGAINNTQSYSGFGLDFFEPFTGSPPTLQLTGVSVKRAERQKRSRTIEAYMGRNALKTPLP